MCQIKGIFAYGSRGWVTVIKRSVRNAVIEYAYATSAVGEGIFSFAAGRLVLNLCVDSRNLDSVFVKNVKKNLNGIKRGEHSGVAVYCAFSDKVTVGVLTA